MANKTIYGCVDWTTGQIKFEGEACDSGDYTGCINWTGAHAGQVAVIVNEVNCDDTYYGCVNWATGEFQLVIPDDCCEEYGDDCTYCTADETPLKITVTFSGLVDCATCHTIACNPYYSAKTSGVAAAINGNSFVLTQSGTNNCGWLLTESGSYGTVTYYTDGACTTGSTAKTLNELRIGVYRCQTGGSADGFYCRINVFDTVNCALQWWGVFRHVGAFEDCKAYGSIADCIAVTDVAGILTSSHCNVAADYACYGGTITIQEGDQT